jgi:hypothetical protein
MLFGFLFPKIDVIPEYMFISGKLLLMCDVKVEMVG